MVKMDFIQKRIYQTLLIFIGKTKSLGEIIENKNLTLRTSIIGPRNKKFNGEGSFTG